jgi:hypothetical protein
MLDEGSEGIIVRAIESHRESEDHLKGDNAKNLPDEALSSAPFEITIEHQIRRGVLISSVIFLILDRISEVLSGRREDFLSTAVRRELTELDLVNVGSSFSIHFE